MEKDSIAVNQKSYSLLEVLQSIQSVLKNNYGNKNFWVRCELSRISLHEQSGHCYLELIEKNELSVVAQLHGIIWADKYKFITEKFHSVTQTKLAAGIKIMFQCSVSFHPAHGLSLIISDVEPSFTLGEMARMKNEAIVRLKKEGLFDLNRSLKLVILPKRIAVISVSTSRGYQDFITTIENHPGKFSISCVLFEAILQGDNAVPSLIRAIQTIEKEKENFDAIVLVRGGAGDAGLACYDDYSLAAMIANSKMPVITGIGHATNETVVELVSFKNCITPTAAATFVLEKFEKQVSILNESIAFLGRASKINFNDVKQALSAISEIFCLQVNHNLSNEESTLKNLHSILPSLSKNFFLFVRLSLTQSIQSIAGAKSITERNKELLVFNEHKIKLLDPVNTLKRGFSITRHNGKALMNVNDVTPGTKIETSLANGVLYSKVEK